MKTQLLRNNRLQSEHEKISLLFWELRKKYGASGLKLSTEDAGMSFEQIAYWAKIASPVMPVIVKIGGPEARNDMKMILNLNEISGIIAPMIESAYSLKNYIDSLKEIFRGEKLNRISKHINIETITAFQNLSRILSCPEANFINEITIGRGDLSRSISKEVDDPEVSRISKIIVEEAKRRNISVSIGGAVNPENAKRIFKEMKPDKINTRSVVFNRESPSDIKQSILKALEFEIEMIKEDHRLGFVLENEAQDRVVKLNKRIATN